ncbi:NTP transferase domain-containing protein [Marinobacter sp. F3R11]|uniref:nucleotidyltransferase family protein n=1 Tax=Marinobacter sp. F3R11 TaxID=2267231 RepID=UPI0021C767C3|nr:nucleotidyltransferase family protein [Marinobacter sp. F3R11]
MLAAGASTRFGSPKALLTVSHQGGERRSLLDCAIGQARLLGRDVRVVCGAWYPLVRFRCRAQPCRWVHIADWQMGMAASLAAGIRSLGPRAKGVFVLLADQPLLDRQALEAFAERARRFPGEAVAADYGRRPGVPAYLPRKLWPGVLSLHGDCGAAGVLAEANAIRLHIPGVHDDVDTPEDWRRIRNEIIRTSPRTRQLQD